MFANIVLVGVFVVAITLPVLDRLFALDPAPATTENRELAPRPVLPDSWSALREFPAAFEHHWNDTFGFRRSFVRFYNRMLVALHTSPFPDQVTVGTDGWLFYAAEGALAEYKGEHPFREGEMMRWQFLLENRRDWLKDRGIPYLFIIAPSKETMYGNHMPSRIRRGAIHRLDQLLDFMAAHSDFEIVDPRALLASAAKSEDVYMKTDSHWSPRGAWLVTEAVIDRLAETYPALKQRVPIELRAWTAPRAGDLVGMLGLVGLLSERVTFLEPGVPRAHRTTEGTSVSSWTEVDDPKLPSAVFFHDSFGKMQRDFFAEHFRSLRSVHVPELDPEIVEAERPEIVFQEMAERLLGRRPPGDSMVVSDNSRVRAAFDASTDVLLRLARDGAAMTAVPPSALERRPDGTITVRAANPRSSVQLPAFQADAGSFPVLRLRIESPADARLEIYTTSTVDPDGSGTSLAWWPLREGPNVVWMTFPDPELSGYARLDLTAPGTYRLTSLEVRAVPRARHAPRRRP